MILFNLLSAQTFVLAAHFAVGGCHAAVPAAPAPDGGACFEWGIPAKGQRVKAIWFKAFYSLGFHEKELLIEVKSLKTR